MSNRIIKNLSWSAGGVLLSKAFTPVLSILIARLITPEQFGNYALAVTIIFSLDFIKDFGFNEAIISSDSTFVNDKVSHQFTIQLFISLSYLVVLFPFSFFANSIFNTVNIGLMIRVLSVTLIFRSFTDAIFTKFIKEANFRPLFFRTIIPSTIYGSVSLVLLHNGYDEKALAFGFLGGEFFLFLFLLQKERSAVTIIRKFKYSEFVNYGKHIVVQKVSSGLLLSKLDGIILSFFYSSNVFGMYRMSRNLSNVLPSTILKEVSNVIFSEVSSNRDSKHVSEVYNNFGIRGSFLLLVLSVFIIPVVPYLVPLVLGKQWMGVIVTIQIFILSIPSFQIRNTQQVILKSQKELFGLSIILLVYSFIFLVALFLQSIFKVDLVSIAKSIVVLDCVYSIANACLFYVKVKGPTKGEILFYFLFIAQIIIYTIVL